MDSLAQGITDLNNDVARALQADASQANASGAYSQAQRDLEDQQEIRRMLLLKIASEKTDVQLPKSSPVQIVDRAFPSSRPATPNRPRAIGFIGGGAMLAMLGFVLARTGRSRVEVAAAI